MRTCQNMLVLSVYVQHFPAENALKTEEFLLAIVILEYRDSSSFLRA